MNSGASAIRNGIVVFKGTIGATNEAGSITIKIDGVNVGYEYGGNNNAGDGYTETYLIAKDSVVSWSISGAGNCTATFYG